MKKSVLIVLFLSLNITAYNQVIKGTILDQRTHTPIFYATAYFNGTFVGTYSDQNGKFEINIAGHVSMPLTISALGYYSVILTNLSKGTPEIIYMTPKLIELGEVVINGKSRAKERKANLGLFKDEFLGSTLAAGNCKITNENDISFENNSDTLKAFSSKPILIDNKALGYKVIYFLDKFEYYKKSKFFLIRGNIKFAEDLTNDESKKQFYESNREYAYLGSRMHFFRSLWANKLDSAGFSVKNMGSEQLTYKDIVNQPDITTKYLKYHGDINICYKGEIKGTNVVFVKDKIFFYEHGYFDPFAVSWEGEMAKQRIADWLPLEYSIK
jgi:CarboxypepD_reg-like domain